MNGFQRVLCLLIFIIAGFNSKQAAYASANYNSYTYNEWKESVAAPDSYTAVTSKTGIMLGSGVLNQPQDMYMGPDGMLYIADTGNNRLIIVDKNLNLVKIIDGVMNNGVKEPITDPQGLYVSADGTIYITQPSLSRVILVKDDNVITIIEKPVNDLIPADFQFQPTKVGVDIYGRIYVLSKGCYTGLLQFDSKGNFMDYYGANKVEVTAKVLFQYAWKNILSDDQRNAMTSILPIEYSNIDCSTDGFVYTTTVGTATPFNQVKKLNPLGNNTYYRHGNKEINFGDYERSYNLAATVDSSFVDVKVDSDGFIFGLDNTRGRIFERDQEGNLISVFGGLGNQSGTFSAPIAVEVYENNIYVLDSLKNNLTLFQPTEYETLLRKATISYNNGLYQESADTWKQVLKRNRNNTMAYEGLGKALSQNGSYEESLKYLKDSGERYSYSRSFSKLRLQVIRSHGTYIVLGLVFLVLCSSIRNSIMKRKLNRRMRR
ncbi:MAG TPA: hypothetical protein VN258_01810 [Mobilitalea sp.]|nr:hypothetical protein [Mobilitalea sp.]